MKRSLLLGAAAAAVVSVAAGTSLAAPHITTPKEALGQEVLQRGQPHGTFKLPFNSVLYGPVAGGR
ncbi:hypothetical protein DJ021_10985 [Phenylobacterium hankyongense]|uniref:Alpha/beta hydrolase n=1 Tax=Phenylobacterium hankyongense TaxID=1813876 RepID=A0A328AZE0_9CAUL|nr:hypothetical protein [Phenylobacterium hankyongense]RAK60293.1 hypothetical protein DJ021_10985 [Phenylobacterium hankyongense]